MYMCSRMEKKRKMIFFMYVCMCKAKSMMLFFRFFFSENEKQMLKMLFPNPKKMLKKNAFTVFFLN